MAFARALLSCLSLLLVIAAASENCRSDVCKGDQVSLLQTVTKVQKAVEPATFAATASLAGYVSTGGKDETRGIDELIGYLEAEEKHWEHNIRLKVTLKSGKNLEDRDYFGQSDSYCKIKLVTCDGCDGNKDETEKQSPVVTGSHPTWNFKWETVDWSKGDRVQFDCYDEDSGTDDHLGKGYLELNRNMAFEGDVALDRKGHLRVAAEWQDCSGDCEPMSVTMAEIAGKVYSFDTQAGNYHIIYAVDIAAVDSQYGKDHLALYKKRGSSECALAFSGSNDAFDWVNNFNALSEKGTCGYDKVHKGFVAETRNFFKSSSMAELSEIISRLCGGVVSSVGHSLGGAVANIVAGCANSPKGLSGLGQVHKDVKSFKVSGLYTVGAPGVSKPAMTNTGGTCFPGKRAFNYDTTTFDVVAWIATKFGYLHPEVEAVEMTESGGWFGKNDEVISKVVYTCSSTEAEHRPWKTGQVAPAKAPSVGDHKTSTYVHRFKALFSK